MLSLSSILDQVGELIIKFILVGFGVSTVCTFGHVSLIKKIMDYLISRNHVKSVLVNFYLNYI